jgi:ABC-type transport system involved in multi-copper enzyme maturation permease subunit
MHNRIATIARYTTLEAVRTHFALLAVVIIAVTVAASFFVRELAVTESARFQTAFYAAGVRFAMVFVASLYAIASISREFQDKGLDVTLALDLPRSHYIVGKLVGFLAIAIALSIFAALPLIAFAGPEGALQWGASLAFELAIVVALSLFCVVTFNTLMPAASLVFAFYVLARSLSAIRLMSANPIVDADAPSQHVMSAVVEGLALVVPALDRWTQTVWLLGEPPPWSGIALLAGQSLVFVTVLAAAAVFDMQRKNF